MRFPYWAAARWGARMPSHDSSKGFLATDAAILVDAFDGALRELQVDRTRPKR